MHGPQPLRFAAFRHPDDPLRRFQRHAQAQYLTWYLSDLGAKSVLVEAQYFDRDYLSEFSGFYAASAAGYPNVCERAHYFKENVDRKLLTLAAGGDQLAATNVQAAYLGFVVVRPIPKTPFGRTVLKNYPDNVSSAPRVTNPCRSYQCHVAGLTLEVDGLAWQQQDQGVGGCATIALWSMLQSQAFDDRHIVPTTAEVTGIAQSSGSALLRGLPSRGLALGQLAQTIRDCGFEPQAIPPDSGGFFSLEHFNTSVAAFIRSGYPILVLGGLGRHVEGGEFESYVEMLGAHAVCAVGFRQAVAGRPAGGTIEFEDLHNTHIYLHDDNLGPSVRFRVDTDENQRVLLVADSPKHTSDAALPDPTHGIRLRPEHLLAASHSDVRLSPDDLHDYATAVGLSLSSATPDGMGFTVTARVTPLVQYLGEELQRTLAHVPELLGRVRLELSEGVRPMSRHLGLVRFGVGSGCPVLDVLLDTTDSVPNLAAFCHVVYDSNLAATAAYTSNNGGHDLGVQVHAF